MKQLLSRQLCIISGLLLLALSPNVVTQARAGSEKDLKARRTEFLKPLNPQFILSPNDPLLPQFCARSERCPPIVSNGGVGGGGIPQLELDLKARLPNVRVSFLIQEISHDVVVKPGVAVPAFNRHVNWHTTGPESDAENGGVEVGELGDGSQWSLPLPGAFLTYSGLLIYDALVFGACESLTSFDVQHEATIVEFIESQHVALGSFVGVDNTTIDSTGYYNLNYTVRATDSNGGVSDFHFSGKADVICSGLDALPEAPFPP